jgi:prepilin-type N-terminal cleavage/methylation domain-containing protein
MKIKNGFSLIELIVVITIIAVITAVGMVSFGGANKKSRDSKRMADLERYRVALEMVRQIGGTYPATADFNVITAAPYNAMPALLSDPKTGYSYVYYRSTPYTYSLWACVEVVGSANSPASGNNCDAPSGPCSCSGGNCLGSTGCNYRVQNP